MNTVLNGISALPHLGVIQAQGEDAANFLHNQLSNDVLLLPVGQARLAAFCSAKGRMQASFILVKTAPDTVLLVLSLDLLAQTLKRLSMFVLRAKVKMSDATGQWQLRGLLGDTARAVVGGAAPWQTVTVDGVHAVALYPALAGDVQVPRALCLAPAGSTLPADPEVAPEVWVWSEVMSGVTLVSQPLFEAFVPQMLNYESVGGVNFKKGCYPGQEVVARSQFRGTLKRRTALVHSPVALAAGQDIFTPADPEQPCATVVLSAARPDGQGFDALVSGTLESQQTGWRVGSAEGAALELLTLPYPLLEDI
ncbi:folate-binding protein YgfZ [Limnohabitans planktonicus II-D5]|uniref:Folate-binding protein YgfZ n=2 Tax=Limnohabitans planktonicus TaxID=540060 RepID=A0A2T7UIE3_9BURK|nr:folate-binding protein YgfZ [Limnohabitans planktonicus]PVE44421.1 folate-binding protein YgfZ [Limnohabitans planktonicus II-D5]|eukprot:gene3679-3596_t